MYVLAVAATIWGVLRSGSEIGVAAEEGPVTIIVAARNERSSIGTCVRSILAQSHQELSLIVVDDRSDDGTAELAATAAEGDPRLRVLRIPADGEGGKKRALMKGIEASETEILLFTDADCVPGPCWVSGMASALSPEVAFVAGYAPYHPRGTLLARLVAAEAGSNAVTACGLIGLGVPVMCTARNMGYRRSAYDAVGGLGPVAHVASGDDTLMLQRIARIGRVKYVTDPATHVPSSPPDSVGGWFAQKSRHLSTLVLFSPPKLLAAVVSRSMDILVFLSVPLVLAGWAGPWIFIAWGVKAVADFGALWLGLGELGERQLLRVFPVLELVYSYLLVFFVLAGMTRRIQWK
ncbi:MAG: glycosyltransferase involved in cell wall biosynthesis [Rhodothermales bacterium]